MMEEEKEEEKEATKQSTKARSNTSARACDESEKGGL